MAQGVILHFQNRAQTAVNKSNAKTVELSATPPARRWMKALGPMGGAMTTLLSAGWKAHMPSVTVASKQSPAGSKQ